MHYFLSRQLMAMQAITPHRQEKYTNIMHEVFEKTINVSKARIDNIDQDRKKKQRIETRDDHKYAEGGRSSLSTVNLAFPPRVPQPSFQNVGIRTRLNNENAKTIQYESSSSRKSIVTVGSGHSTNVSSPDVNAAKMNKIRVTINTAHLQIQAFSVTRDQRTSSLVPNPHWYL